MRKFLFLFLLFPLGLQAQDSLYFVKPRVQILKFSPLSLVDPHASLQFAYEYQLKGKSAFQHELGYMISSIYISEDYMNPRGVRFRNEYRHYLNPENHPLGGFYLAPELLFMYVRFDRNSVFGKSCRNPFNSWDCNYYQHMDYTLEKQVYAFHQKIGYQDVFPPFVFDIYCGIGYRHVRINDLNKPANEQDDFSYISIYRDEGKYNLLSLSLGFKFGYILFHQKYKRLEQRW